MCLESLWKWAQIKGITVIGTGDFTHPGWYNELKEKLEYNDNNL
jgi:PHP family Zn ribbon phosphoesterase